MIGRHNHMQASGAIPPTYQQTSLSLEPEMVEEIKGLARCGERTLSGMARYLLRLGLMQHRREQLADIRERIARELDPETVDQLRAEADAIRRGSNGSK